jgi:DNA-binding transcriptional MerR regulator
MELEALKVGELARRTGLTIRTLHHYDDIGLVKPSLRTEVGYRVYIPADVARLQHVISLRQLGLTLDEIRNCLDRPEFAPLEVIRLHLARLRKQMESQQALCERLEAIAAHFCTADEVSTDDLVKTIEAMTFAERYFTPEQLTLIKRRREEAGDELLRERQEDWAKLIADIRAKMDGGVDPTDAKVLLLAERWLEMVDETTAGDPQLEQSLKRLWDEQGDVLAAQHGTQYDPRPVFGYITRAVEALKAS